MNVQIESGVTEEREMLENHDRDEDFVLFVFFFFI